MLIPFLGYRGGMGRTHAILQVAQQLAEWGKQVLVVDLDFPSPAVGLYIGLSEGTAGTANFLATRRGSRRRPGYPEEPAEPPALPPLRDYITSVSGGFDALPADRLTNLRQITGREAFNKPQLAELYRALREEPYEFILIDMPPGNLALMPMSLRQFILAADVLSVFVSAGPEHRQYMDQIRALKRLPPVLWVAAMVPLEEEKQVDQWLRNQGAEYSVSLPWVTALASPFTGGWSDSRFLSDYRQLAEALGDLIDLRREVEPVPAPVVEIAIRALERSREIPPTVLTSRLRAFMNPRALVVTGRHGAGRSALTSAISSLFRDVSRKAIEGLLQGQLSTGTEWEQAWIRMWQNDIATRSGFPVYDDLDLQLIDAIGWARSLEAIRGLLRAAVSMREIYGEDWQARILLLPGTIHAAGVRMKARQIRTITWTKPELLEMALQRAVEHEPEFAAYLGVRHKSRLFTRELLRHEDWTRPELESIATILFGPQGLTVWTDTLPGPYESELVPGEVADLLARAMRHTWKTDRHAGVLVSPKVLRETLDSYAIERVEWLLGRVGDRTEARFLLTHSHTLDGVDPEAYVVAEMLNYGLLVWSDEEERKLQLPPLVKQAITSI